MMNIRLLIVIISTSLLFTSCSENNVETVEVVEAKYYTQGDNNRTAAEWEPALGTLISWPLSLPYKLVIELASDNHLFTMVEDKASRQEAEKWFSEWDIDPADVTFIYAKQGVDVWWTRDWGPSAVFNSDKEYALADGKYIFSTPVTDLNCNDSLAFIYVDDNNEVTLTQTDDDATIPLAKQLGYNLVDLPFNNTGGNVFTDGLGTAFSSCVLLTENKHYGLDKEKFFQLNNSILGFKNYNIISNFEKTGIQHIDCLLKLIDEETILVAEPPVDHALFSVYDDIVKNELQTLKSVYGNPYRILRLKSARYTGENLAAYTNSLILNKTVYVPLFGIPQDEIALKTWGEVMPGYKIKGFEFVIADQPYETAKLEEHYGNQGWNNGDALHCRTRAIWNPDMLFISINKTKPIVERNQVYNIYTTIIDYSGEGLIEDQCKMHWRQSGEIDWNSIQLSQASSQTHYLAKIPSQDPGTTIEYYISAVSNSGERESRPATAPLAFYTFTIE